MLVPVGDYDQSMAGLTDREIDTVVYRYIGVNDGFLGDFSYASHAQFYPLYCDLNIDPYSYRGTTRERFIEILKAQSPRDQAKILRGVLERFPVDDPDTHPKRTPALKDEIDRIRTRLEQNAPVSSPDPLISTPAVYQALLDAENLIQTSGPVSAVDRIHTALHGHLIAVCDQQNIAYEPSAMITRLLRLLRQQHPALQNLAAGNQDADKVLNAFGTILDALNNMRNHASLAHPNQTLLDSAEAMLAINAARTIIHYLDERLHSPDFSVR